MARLQEIKEIPPFNLNKFYGLHIEPTGETQLKRRKPKYEQLFYNR